MYGESPDNLIAMFSQELCSLSGYGLSWSLQLTFALFPPRVNFLSASSKQLKRVDTGLKCQIILSFTRIVDLLAAAQRLAS